MEKQEKLMGNFHLNIGNIATMTLDTAIIKYE